MSKTSDVVSSLRLLRILLWKNLIHYRRKLGWTLFSFCAPILLIAVLLIFRRRVPPESVSLPTVFNAFSVDSLPRGNFDLKAFAEEFNISDRWSYYLDEYNNNYDKGRNYSFLFTEYRRKYEGDEKRQNFSIGNFGWSDIPWAELERWELERANSGQQDPVMSAATSAFDSVFNSSSAAFYSVAFSPENAETKAIMENFKKSAGIRQLMPFPSEDKMVEELKKKRAFAVDLGGGGGGILSAFVPGIVGGMAQGLDSSAILCGISFDATEFKSQSKVATLFSQSETINRKIRYSLRFPHSPTGSTRESAYQRAKQWNTDKTFPRRMEDNGPRDPSGKGSTNPGYYEQGFLALQWILNKELIKYYGEDNNNNNGNDDGVLFVDELLFGLKQFAYAPYWNDPFAAGIQFQLPFLLIICFLIVCLNITRNVAKEKEMALKETMKVMGLSNSLYWTSWFITSLVHCLVILFAMTFLFKITVREGDDGGGAGGGAVINNTPGIVIFVFLFIYVLALISFCFLISTIFKKANTAAIGGGVIFFLTFIPYFVVFQNYDALPLSAKMGCGIFLNTGLAIGCIVLGNYESKGTGLTWADIATPVNVDDDLAMIHVWIILLVDAVLCWVLAWYIEKIRPGDFGAVYPFYFPFTKSYWCPRSSSNKVDDDVEDPSNDVTTNPYFESRTSDSAQPGVRIRNLQKTFKTGFGASKTFQAVKGVSLDMFPGEIFVLLGENGAGKSTTINCLMGLTDPTEGAAWINGFHVKTETGKARRSMGICPQHDVLFDLLTVEEHLNFYGRLKNKGRAEDLSEVVDQLLEDLDLKVKKDALASTLSGGQKRKLSLAVAMIGKPSVLLLDEPTSGMDPKNRRITWQMLRKHKKDTTILLTTHFMDEAESLANVVGIMSRGKIVCSGSPLHLKNKVGNNYHLIVSKAEGAEDEKIGALIKNHIPEAYLERSTLVECSFGLPREQYGKFSAIFDDIDENRESIKVESYACAAPNIEEVFLKVCREKSQEARSGVDNPGYASDSADAAGSDAGAAAADNASVSQRSLPRENDMNKNEGFVLYRQQFYAMLVKKLLHTWRNKLVTIGQLLIPNIFTLLILVVIKIVPPLVDSPSLKLSLDGLGETVTPFSFNGSLQKEFASLFKTHVESDDNIVQRVPIYGKYDKISPIDRFMIKNTETQSGKFRDGVFIGGDFTKVDSECERYVDPDVSEITDEVCEIYKLEERDANISSLATGTTPFFIGYFNDQAFHSAPIVTQYFSNAIASYFGVNIEASNHPLPRTFTEELDDELTINARFSSSFNFGFLFGMSFLAATFTILLIKERISKAKHIQIVSGLHTLTFWLATFVWDYINFLAPCLITLILFYAFNIKAFKGSQTSVALVVLLFFIAAQLPLVYLFSLLFHEATTGFVYTTIIGIFTGIALQMTVAILDGLDLRDSASIVDQIALLLSPPYNVGKGMQNIYLNYWNGQICNLNVTSTQELVKSFIPTGLLQNTPFSSFSPLNEDQIIDVILAALPNYEIPGYGVTLEGLLDKPPTEALCFFMETANITYPCCPNSGCADTAVGCAKHVVNYSLEAPGVGMNLIYFSIQCFVFFFLITLYEMKVLRSISGLLTRVYSKLQSLCRRKNLDDEQTLTDSIETSEIQLAIEDDNIEKEQKRIERLNSEEGREEAKPTLMIDNLRKVYSKLSGEVKAVNGISMCVDKGELFGLLGVNGAGKTTTFKMLTGDEAPTSGSIFVEPNLDIRSDLKAIQQKMGYCPQTNALIDQMTGRETLRMYCRLRGIREWEIDGMIINIAEDLVLTEHLDKWTGRYSGGNKRKLSTAIAMIGDPAMVLLDEPTTGMDPSARRQLWDSLIKIRNRSRQCIILTSHSMEECEALCTRISIMMKGQIQCLGSPQYLKDKYAENFYLEAEIKGENSRELIQELRSKVGGILEESEGNGKVSIKIPKKDKRWAQIFQLVECTAKELGLKDYVLSQSSLERVFLSISETAEQ